MLVFVFVFDFLCLMLIECSGVARRQTSVGAERVWRRGGDLCAQVLFVSVVLFCFFVWRRSTCPGSVCLFCVFGAGYILALGRYC